MRDRRSLLKGLATVPLLVPGLSAAVAADPRKDIALAATHLANIKHLGHVDIATIYLREMLDALESRPVGPNGHRIILLHSGPLPIPWDLRG